MNKESVPPVSVDKICYCAVLSNHICLHVIALLMLQPDFSFTENQLIWQRFRGLETEGGLYMNFSLLN